MVILLRTDHISPAGIIPENYPAGHYLIKKNITFKDLTLMVQEEETMK